MGDGMVPEHVGLGQPTLGVRLVNLAAGAGTSLTLTDSRSVQPMRALFRTLVPILVLTAGSAGAFAATTAGDAEARLNLLFQSEWERGLREDPLAATYIGDHRYDNRWPDLSAERAREEQRR